MNANRQDREPRHISIRPLLAALALGLALALVLRPGYVTNPEGDPPRGSIPAKELPDNPVTNPQGNPPV